MFLRIQSRLKSWKGDESSPEMFAKKLVTATPKREWWMFDSFEEFYLGLDEYKVFTNHYNIDE